MAVGMPWALRERPQPPACSPQDPCQLVSSFTRPSCVPRTDVAESRGPSRERERSTQKATLIHEKFYQGNQAEWGARNGWGRQRRTERQGEKGEPRWVGSPAGTSVRLGPGRMCLGLPLWGRVERRPLVRGLWAGGLGGGIWGVPPRHFLLWASVSTPEWAGVVGALPCPLKPVQGEMLGWTAGPTRRCRGPCPQVHGAKWGDGQKAWRSRGWGRGRPGLEILLLRRWA